MSHFLSLALLVLLHSGEPEWEFVPPPPKEPDIQAGAPPQPETNPESLSGPRPVPLYPPGGSGPGAGEKRGRPATADWARWWVLNRERILAVRTVRELKAGGGGGETPDREARLAPLRAAVKDPDPAVRGAAIVALGEARDAASLPVLRGILAAADEDCDARGRAALAIGLLGGGAEEDRKALAKVAEDGAEERPTRCMAAVGLGYLGDPGALAPLTALSRSADDPAVAACATVALGLLGDARAAEDLSRRLSGPAEGREKDPRQRALTAHALGLLRSRSALGPLADALRDPAEEVRRQAALSLGVLARADDDDAVDALVGMMDRDRDPLARGSAALALGETGSPLAASALLVTWMKGDPVVAPCAAVGMGLLIRNSGSAMAREMFVPLLREELARPGDPNLRGAVAVALGLAKDHGSQRALTRLLTSKDGPRGHAAAALGMTGATEAVPDLRAAVLGQDGPGLRDEAALALALLGDRESVAMLTALLAPDRSEAVRFGALRSLGRLAAPADEAGLARILATRTEPATLRAMAAVALGRIEEPHPLPLLSRVGDGLSHRLAIGPLAQILAMY